jgi:hypothetical protein
MRTINASLMLISNGPETAAVKTSSNVNSDKSAGTPSTKLSVVLEQRNNANPISAYRKLLFPLSLASEIVFSIFCKKPKAKLWKIYLRP